MCVTRYATACAFVCIERICGLNRLFVRRAKFVDDGDDVALCHIEIDYLCRDNLIIGRFAACDEFVEFRLFSVETLLFLLIVGDCVEISVYRAQKA